MQAGVCRPPAACHSDRPDATGPGLRGAYGRKSASRDDFRYFNAMARAKLVWDEANLRAYLNDSQGQSARQSDAVRRVARQKDTDDLIAYLKTFRQARRSLDLCCVTACRVVCESSST